MRHPLEAYLGPALLQLFEHPAKRARLFNLAQESRGPQAEDMGMHYQWKQQKKEQPLKVQPVDAKSTPHFSDDAFPTKSVVQAADRLALGFSAIAVSFIGCPSHAGGHAAYLVWLISELAAISLLPGCFSCFTKKRVPGAPLTDSERKAVIRTTFRTGLKFSRFKHLPLSMDHRYWGSLSGNYPASSHHSCSSSMHLPGSHPLPKISQT